MPPTCLPHPPHTHYRNRLLHHCHQWGNRQVRCFFSSQELEKAIDFSVISCFHLTDYIPNLPNSSYVNTGYGSPNQPQTPIHVITVPYRRRRPLNICGIIILIAFLVLMYWMWRTGYNEFKEFRSKYFKDEAVQVVWKEESR